jgi:hypothetical protein
MMTKLQIDIVNVLSDANKRPLCDWVKYGNASYLIESYMYNIKVFKKGSSKPLAGITLVNVGDASSKVEMIILKDIHDSSKAKEDNGE